MNWKGIFKLLGHAALGGAAAAVAPPIMAAIPAIPHIDPATAAALGSVVSSVVSALSKPPHEE